MLDGNGDLFGTTITGGASGDGTVFELSPVSGSYSSYSLSTLFSFNGTNGADPYAGVTLDADGDIFGCTAGGGTNRRWYLIMAAIRYGV